LQTETGVPATTSTLAVLDGLEVCGVRRYGLAVPYSEGISKEIVAAYSGEGLECGRDAYLGLSTNFAFDQVESERVKQLVCEAAPGNDGVAVVCTNFRA